jgi:hypothetical protein
MPSRIMHPRPAVALPAERDLTANLRSDIGTTMKGERTPASCKPRDAARGNYAEGLPKIPDSEEGLRGRTTAT